MFIHIINEIKYYLKPNWSLLKNRRLLLTCLCNQYFPTNTFSYSLFFLKENGAKEKVTGYAMMGLEKKPGTELSRGLCRPEPKIRIRHC